jgi:hypothetical protein
MDASVFDVYEEAPRAQLFRRIATWRAEDRPLWGKFDARAAVCHCQQPLRVALGELRLPRTWVGRLFGGLVKRSMLGSRPFARNLPTESRFLVPSSASFEAERDLLTLLLRRFGEAGPRAAPRGPHPFFGALSPKQWALLMGKHLDHHLRQFGR